MKTSLSSSKLSALSYQLHKTLLTAGHFVARTYLFDEVIMQHAKEGFDMIINLAAGLDTHPYRLSLPSTLTWQFFRLIRNYFEDISSIKNIQMTN